MAREVLRHPAARADQFGKPRQRLRILFQQGQIGRPAAHALEKFEDALERRIGVGGGCRAFDGERHQPVEPCLAGGRHLPVTRALTQRVETALQLERAAKTQLCKLLDITTRIAAFLPERGERMLVLVASRDSELDEPYDVYFDDAHKPGGFEDHGTRVGPKVYAG